MNKSEKRKEKMNELAKLFNAQTGEKVSRSCSGKWSGTIDYSIRFNNGYEKFISNDDLSDDAVDYSTDNFFEPDDFANKTIEYMKELEDDEQED